jgi:hypothetical protein
MTLNLEKNSIYRLLPLLIFGGKWIFPGFYRKTIFPKNIEPEQKTIKAKIEAWKEAKQIMIKNFVK